MQTHNYDLLRQKYAEKSDDELLLLACESGGLTEEAQQMLTEELGRRKLGLRERQEYGEHVAQVEAIEVKRMSRLAWLLRLSGFGFLASLVKRGTKK